MSSEDSGEKGGVTPVAERGQRGSFVHRCPASPGPRSEKKWPEHSPRRARALSNKKRGNLVRPSLFPFFFSHPSHLFLPLPLRSLNPLPSLTPKDGSSLGSPSLEP